MGVGGVLFTASQTVNVFRIYLCPLQEPDYVLTRVIVSPSPMLLIYLLHWVSEKAPAIEFKKKPSTQLWGAIRNLESHFIKITSHFLLKLSSVSWRAIFTKSENNFASSRRSGPSANSHFVSASSCVPPLHLEGCSGPILVPEVTLDALKTYITRAFLHQLVGFCGLSAEMGAGCECV